MVNLFRLRKIPTWAGPTLGDYALRAEVCKKNTVPTEDKNAREYSILNFHKSLMRLQHFNGRDKLSSIQPLLCLVQLPLSDPVTT